METIYELETFKVKLAVSESLGTKAGSAEDAVRLLRPIYADLDADQEYFTILLLNNKNKVRGHKVISSGGQNNALVDPAVVFRAALLFGASALVLAHNHPSGSIEPSDEDFKITKRLWECGQLFGIRVLDHIILGSDRYFSFSDRDMMHAAGSGIACPPPRLRKTRSDCGVPRGPRKKKEPGAKLQPPSIERTP